MEELKSEKAVLLNQLDCADDVGIAAIKKDIASVGVGLSKLEQQEEKYASKLEAALREYTDLKDQGADFEPAQKIALLSENITSVSHRIQSDYGEKYDPLVMFDSQRNVAELLDEEANSRFSAAMQRKQKPQQIIRNITQENK